MGRSRRKEVTQCRGAWPRDVLEGNKEVDQIRSRSDWYGSRGWIWTYVWQARVCEGPGERPAAGVALDQLSEGIVRD